MPDFLKFKTENVNLVKKYSFLDTREQACNALTIFRNDHWYLKLKNPWKQSFHFTNRQVVKICFLRLARRS